MKMQNLDQIIAHETTIAYPTVGLRLLRFDDRG
jgi:hypothetical protein